MRLLLFPLLLLVASPAAATAGASSTASCELVPHGALAAIETEGCAVSGHATSSVQAVVSVTQGTVDAIEIEMVDSAGARHVFLCTYQVFTATCLFPVQETDAADGIWTVRARIVAADPLGPFLFGGADTYARLDVTFG